MDATRRFLAGTKFNAIALSLAGLIGSTLVACSSPPDATEDETFNDEGRMFVAASPQTHAELGVATWVVSDREVMGLDAEDRIQSTVEFPAANAMAFYGEEHGDLPPFAEGTTASKTLERVAADLRSGVTAEKQDVQQSSVSSSLSPQKVNGGGGDGTGCRSVQGIGVRGTPMTKIVCPGVPPPSRWDGCTGADGNCPVSGVICRSCGSPQPPQSAQPPAQSEPECTVRAEGPSDGAGTTLVRDCPDGAGDDDDAPQLVTPPTPLVSRSCTTPPRCKDTLGNYYSNKMLLAQCKTPDSCAYWDNMVKKDLPFVQSSGCAACFGGR